MATFKLQWMLVVPVFLSTISCSSVNTIESTDEIKQNGLSYFMPKKDILITINTKKDKSKSVSVGVSPPYPDLSKQ